MKKSILIGILGIGTAVASYGQGNVLFNNYYGTYQTTGITYASGPSAGLGVGSEISVQLYFGASTDTLFSQLAAVPGSVTPVGINGITTPGTLGVPFAGAGVFDAGTTLVNGGTPGTFAFAIYASGTYLGTPYTGVSGIVVGATQANSLAPVPFLPASLQQGSFVVNPVPEPTTLALGALGGLALLAFRRKQA
jgi:hypothetical protein